MAIVNRDLFSTQQRDCYSAALAPTATGLTYAIMTVPYPATLIAANVSANGLSGAPNYSLWLQRFIAGSGITSIPMGTSQVITTFGTSGAIGFSLNGSGASFPLLAGDALILSTAAANTSSASTSVTIVIQALQDIKSHFGVA